MSSPGDENASTASLESSQTDNIDISKTPAAVFWTDDNGHPQFLSHNPTTHDHIMLDIHFDTESNTALFKVTANVAYKGKRNKSNIFLLIYPERIQSLTVVDNDETAPAKLGTSAYSLHFALTTPPSLMVPRGDWVPKNETARSTLALLQAVAKKTSFRVTFPSRTLAVDRLVALCEKASSSGCLKTPPNATDVSRLYGGKGGVTIEHGGDEASAALPGGRPSRTVAEAATQAADVYPGDIKSAVDQHQSSESPPSYDELGHSSRPPPSAARKRRRLDPDVATRTPGHEKMSLEDICRHGFMEIGRRFDRIEQALVNLSSRLDRVEQLAVKSRRGDSRSGEQEVQEPEKLDGRIGRVEEHVTELEHKLEVGLSDLVQDVENQMYDVRHEFNDTILVRVEDEMGVAQSELEDFVKDELRNAAFEVEEIVREKMRDALA